MASETRREGARGTGIHVGRSMDSFLPHDSAWPRPSQPSLRSACQMPPYLACVGHTKVPGISIVSSSFLQGAGDKFTQLSRLEDRLWVKVEASQRFWQGLPSSCSPATRSFVPIPISTGLHQSIPLNCRCHGEASRGSAPVSPWRCIPGGHGGSPMAAAAEGLQLATLSGRGWTRLAIVVWFCNPQKRMVKSM